jgi:DNA-binding transcriptional MerR regulator
MPAHTGLRARLADGGERVTAPLTVAAVARRLGIAPATLRTWDRRYGLGPSEHTAGAHRRYAGTDVARLEAMQRLIQGGAAPADAARAVLELAETDAAAGRPEARAEEAGTPAPTGAERVRVRNAVRGLLRAAAALDSGALTRTVADSIERRGVVWTWDHLLVPTLVGVGDRAFPDGRGVEVEHVVSMSVMTALAGTTGRLRDPVEARPILLAAADEEQHVLPLHALAASLAERRVSCQLLGARVPVGALAEAVRRTGPAVVFVWSQVPATGDPAVLRALPSLRPAPMVVAAGPGWVAPLPQGVRRVTELVEAVTLLIRTAAG